METQVNPRAPPAVLMEVHYRCQAVSVDDWDYSDNVQAVVEDNMGYTPDRKGIHNRDWAEAAADFQVSGQGWGRDAEAFVHCGKELRR